MEGWFLYIGLAGLVLVGGLLAASPVMLIMFIYNKQQHKYFGRIAEKYQLKKTAAPKGLKMLIRDFPTVQGWYQDKYIHIYAGVSDSSDSIELGVGRSSFKTPLTVIRVKPKQRMFKQFVLRAKKNYKLKKEATVNIDYFDDCFELDVETERIPLANSILKNSVKEDLLRFLARYKQASCTLVMDKEGFWRCNLMYETRNQHRYERALVMLNILLTISEQNNAIARQ